MPRRIEDTNYKRSHADNLRIAAHERAVDANPPICKWCDKPIPKPRRYSQGPPQYCNVEHREEAAKAREREKAAEKRAMAANEIELENGLYDEDKIRRGPLYEKVKRTLSQDVIDNWIRGRHTNQEIQKMVRTNPRDKSVSLTGIGYVRRALFNDRIVALQAAHHQVAPEYAKLLGPPDLAMQALASSDPAAFEKKLDELVDAFVAWRHRFFYTGRGNYVTKDVHRRWIKAILRAIYLGSRVMILSPPRHGKTELLIHFCVWVICRNPDIRVLWVGPNTDIAENCLGQVKELLETHDELKAAYLPPGKTWAPQTRASGNTWTNGKFTVGTRTTPQKQPTMWCTGVGGKTQSLDADFIVVDDPADPDASYTPGGRARIDNWFKTKIASRKMDFTGLAMISSRCHPDDLYAQYVDSPLWEVIVDKAHNQGICGLDMFSPHQNSDCVLFPELNPLHYLREQHDTVGAALFEMMYLNQPRPDGTLIFDPDLIRLRCLHNARDLGVREIGGSYRLVAGLDPAARGVQAAFCWAVQSYTDPQTQQPRHLYHMVDMETQQAGGIEGALRVMADWLKNYGVRLWVVEDNAYQSVFFNDPRVRTFCQANNVQLKPHTTLKGAKADPNFGVASMAPMFHEGSVLLPYATLEARRKVDTYISQLVNFTADRPTQRGKADILMASWFPFAQVIRRWVRDDRETVIVSDPAMSYPGYTAPSFDELPWGTTPYPGLTMRSP